MGVLLKMDKLKKYGWEEVKKHNTRKSCWIVVEREVEGGEKKGIILDITEWAPKHPGGSIIYDGAGGDCTVMFWCYHPMSFLDNCNSYISKYAIGEVENYECIYSVGSKFFQTLKRRMESKIPKKYRCRDWRLWLKSVLILVAIAVLFNVGWVQGNLPAIALLGVLLAQSCINIMHDGIHTSYSKYNWLCGLAAWTFNLTGANFLSYRRVHCFGHHAYTSHNIYDSSIPRSDPILKLHSKLSSHWYQKFQHLYVWLVYSLGSVHFWWGDFKEMTQFWNYPKRPAHVTRTQWAYVILGKAIFVYWYFILPFTWFSWKRALLHCTLLQIFESMTAIIFFAVNHWTEKAALVSDDVMRSHTKDWATLQIITSTNFATKSWWWTQVAGGLNLQIEHHLFPQLVHTRLPDVSEVVRETCSEYGLDYDGQCYPSFFASVKGMVVFLKNIGQELPLPPFPNVSDPLPINEKKTRLTNNNE